MRFVNPCQGWFLFVFVFEISLFHHAHTYVVPLELSGCEQDVQANLLQEILAKDQVVTILSPFFETMHDKRDRTVWCKLG